MTKKICCVCKKEKEKSKENFLQRGFNKNGSEKWTSECLVCRRIAHKQYRKDHPEKFNTNKVCRDKDREKYKEYYREYWRKWRENKYKTSLSYKIGSNISSHLWHSLKRNVKSKSIKILLGCTIEEFRIYIESLFEEGMTWDNYGPIWELDHIIPRAYFDFSKQEDQEKCFHYTNYRPLFKKDNTSKSSNFQGNKYYYK